MPQILQQAGIDSFIYWRGHGDEAERLGLEWSWEAPDRSRVLAINQEDGYVNAAALGHTEIWHAHNRRDASDDEAVAKVRQLFERMAPRIRTGTWLLNNGCDHHPPQRRFAAMLDALAAAFPDTEFTHGSFAEYIDALRRDLPDDLPTWRGELLGGRHALILSGVWSARMPLKQANAACQDLLAHQLEPLLAYAHFVHGRPHRHGLVDHAWRELLKNHPHDSICGCSIDQVHRDMETRFDEVRETGEHLASRTLESLVPNFGPTEQQDRDTLVVVANPLPWRRTEVVERLVILQPLDYDLENLQLLGPDGRPVPFVIKSRRFLQRFWGVDYRNELRADDQLQRMHDYLDAFPERILKTEADQNTELVDCFLELQFLARDLPACGHTVYHLTDRPVADADPVELTPGDLVRADGPVLESARLRVTLHPDGTLDLVDKLTGREFNGLNQLEDIEDAGDEYDWSHATTSSTVTMAGVCGAVSTTEDTGLAATLTAQVPWSLPRGLVDDRSQRSQDLVMVPVTVSVRLTAADDVAHITVSLDNTACDHRLQAVFPTGLATGTMVSDGQFILAERPLHLPATDHWEQPHPGTYPQQDFSYLADGAGQGLAVLADGLPEVQPRDGGLALTLLRSVGWLSRDDFPTRRQTNAGPTIATPDAQCLGPQTLRYALAPLSHGPRDLRRRSRQWLRPSFTRQGVPAGAEPPGFLLEQHNPEITVSAIRKHPTRDSLVVRLWNPTGLAQTDRFTTALPVHAAWLLDILEERQETLHLGEAATCDVDVHLLPHRIVTVELAFAPEPGERP